MNRTVRLIIIALFVVIIGAVAAIFLMDGGGGDDGSPTQVATGGDGGQRQPQATATSGPTLEPTAEPIPVVIAVQRIPRGAVIPPGAVDVRDFPPDMAPFGGFTSVEEVVGKIARTDIYVEEPILFEKLLEDPTALDNLGSVGSDASAVLPDGTVGIAVPMNRLTSVAYAIQPGDRVDVVVSFLFVDLDENFQSALPNTVSLISPSISEDGLSISTSGSVNGRFETETIPIPTIADTGATTVVSQVPIPWPVVVLPSESPRPRLVTQRTIQDALVIHVGDFPVDGRLFGVVPTPSPVPEATAAGQQTQSGSAAAPEPTAVPDRPDIVTLAVPPQEAVMLTWMVEAGVPFTFLLRPPTEFSGVETTQVTLDFIMNRYSITLPAKQGYSIEPAIRSIRQLNVGNTISLRSN